MYLETQIAAAKIGKYATTESGDTLEMVERPQGGLSLVLADGQRSGKPAKAISNLVTRKAISLLAEGVRDGAAARAAHDYLYTYRGGRVSATLNILSIDLGTKTLVISRNSHCPIWIARQGELTCLDEASDPVGIYLRTKPLITELPLEAETYVVAFTDGILSAGQRSSQQMDVGEILPALLAQPHCCAQAIADSLLQKAIDLDDGRPVDDTSIAVMSVIAKEREDKIRRLSASFPIPPLNAFA